MVSIIMPAYNAEKDIGECIDSILRQTFTDWELIIVDDGSTDRTAAVCERYAAEDRRIRVIRQENRGVSGARNRGLESVAGEFIAFVDADDLLPPDSISARMELIGNADIAVAGYELFNKEGTLERMPRCVRKEWDTHDAVRNIIAAGELGYQGYLWNKLFRKDLILEKGLRFDERISVNEDRLFCVAYALCCGTAHLSDSLVYRYRITGNNTPSLAYRVKDKDIKRFMSEFLAFDLALAMVRRQYKDCYFLGAVEAQYSAVRQKQRISRAAVNIVRALNKEIRKYGMIALRAPADILGLKKKTAVAAHMIILK